MALLPGWSLNNLKNDSRERATCRIISHCTFIILRVRAASPSLAGRAGNHAVGLREEHEDAMSDARRDTMPQTRFPQQNLLPTALEA